MAPNKDEEKSTVIGGVLSLAIMFIITALGVMYVVPLVVSGFVITFWTAVFVGFIAIVSSMIGMWVTDVLDVEKLG